MRVTEFGALVVDLETQKNEGVLAGFRLKVGADNRVSLKLVTDDLDWRVKIAKPVAPCRTAKRCAQGDLPMQVTGVMLTAPPGQGDLLGVYAAKQAFHNMTVPQLQKLARLHNVRFEGRAGNTEKELMLALIKFFLPDATPDDITAIMRKRANKFQHDESYLNEWLQEDALELYANLLEVDEAKEIKVRAAEITARSKKAASSHGGASSSRTPISMGSSCTPTWAKKYLPKASGCSISRENRWHIRWTAFYPTGAPPHSHSKCYVAGDMRSERAALRSCLEWAWAQHEKATGVLSPWDFAILTGP